eukprot:597_1
MMSDVRQHEFKKDKTLLLKLTAFTYVEERGQQEDGLKYLHVVLADEKEEEKQYMDIRQHMITQNEFDTSIARLLMFMTGEQDIDNISNMCIQPVCEMTTRDVIELFKTKKQRLLQCGMQRFSVLEQLLTTHNVTGSKLMDAFKQNDNDIRPMNNLLFGVDQQFYDNKQQEKITNQIMKIVDFQLLCDKIKNNLIPKLDICKKIAEYRLSYYFAGGRDKLDEN